MGLARADLPRNLRALEYATDYVGIGELGGENRGPFVEIVQRAAGIPRGSPWCAAFINFAAELGCALVNERSPLESVPLQGLVQSYVDYGDANGWAASMPSPGDLFAIKTGRTGRHDHIGFVLRARGGSVDTVEGNTNQQGSREGDGVFTRSRALDELSIKFLRWWD